MNNYCEDQKHTELWRGVRQRTSVEFQIKGAFEIIHLSADSHGCFVFCFFSSGMPGMSNMRCFAA